MTGLIGRTRERQIRAKFGMMSLVRWSSVWVVLAVGGCFAQSDKVQGGDPTSDTDGTGTSSEGTSTGAGSESDATTGQSATSGSGSTGESTSDDTTTGLETSAHDSGSSTGSEVCVHRVFVTRATFTGAQVGGADLASLRCQMEANDADLGGMWRAVVSDDEQAAILDLSLCGDVILANDGSGRGPTLVATQASWWGNHSAPINRFADGELLDMSTPPVTVWSGTMNDGFPAQNHCEGWSSDEPDVYGAYGWAHNLGVGSWIADGSTDCNGMHRLYCLEQF